MIPLINNKLVFILFAIVAAISGGLLILYQTGLFESSAERIVATLFGLQLVLFVTIFFLLIQNFNRRRTAANQQSLYESIIGGSDDAIVSKDLNGNITSWNRGAIDLFQYTADESLGKNISILIPEDRLAEEIEIMSKIKQNKKVESYDTRRLRKDGSLIDVSVTVSPIHDSNGNILGASKIARDISLRKGYEESMEKSLKEVSDYKYALDESSIVAITDAHGMIKHVNSNFCKISKYSMGELIGKDHRLINSQYHDKEFMRELWQTILSGKIWRGEVRNRAKDGSIYWVYTTIVPFLNDCGKPYQYIAIRSDITDRKYAEKENEINEIRFRNTLDNLLEGVSIVGFDWRYLYVNEAYEKQLDHSKSELLGKSITEKLARIKRTKLFSAIKQCFVERRAVQLEDELEFSHNGKKWFEISIQPLPEGVFILLIDVTEKKHSEQKIRRNEQRFRSMIENGYDLVSVSDKNFKPIYQSPSSSRLSGWATEEVEEIGSINQTHPEDILLLKSRLNDVLTHPGVPVPVSFRTKHKQGHYLCINGNITNMLHNEAISGIIANFHDVTETRRIEDQLKQSEKIYKTIASSIPGSVICLVSKEYQYLLVEGDMLGPLGYSRENLLTNKIQDVLPEDRLDEVLSNLQKAFTGESFTVENHRRGFDVISRYVPLRDENNSGIFAVMIVLFDVSELKNAQREITELNVGLERKIKERTLELEIINKELESFSYSVAHDLRTPLRAVYGYATMLDEDYGNLFNDEGKQLMNRVIYNAKRMGVLIDDLLTFSRLGRKEMKKSRIDMEKLIEECCHDLNLEEIYKGEIKVHMLHPIAGDFSLIKYAMINLLSNAVKYSAKKSKPVIEILSEKKDDNIIYSIKDNGVGFDMAYSDKLFGVFQRLHPSEKFEGTGVGLAIVQRIIERHNGAVWGEGKVDSGAVFYFSLPE